MSLILNFPEDTVEIILKNSKGSINKIDVVATLNSNLGPNSTGRTIIKLDDELIENTEILPNINDVRRRIKEMDFPEEVTINSLENIKRDSDELGLPNVEQLRKLL